MTFIGYRYMIVIMKKINLSNIKNKHQKVIEDAITQLKQITDTEHCYGHTLDVLNFTKKI